MREAVTLIFASAVFLSTVQLARTLTRYPFGLLPPVALALLVCFEALLLNVLSFWSAVTWWTVLIANCGFIAACWMAAFDSQRGVVNSDWRGAGRRWTRRFVFSVRRYSMVWLVLAPLMLLVMLAGAFFAPNNYDSMTYHMTRVAFWIQHRSVAYYTTGTLDEAIAQNLQNIATPGSEYLIFVLQLLAGSDRWGSLVQYISWCSVLVTLPWFLRASGVPTICVGALLLLAATLPMGVLQASSTQTDMVAAAMAFAILVALRDFRVGSGAIRWDRRRAFVCAACISAAYLVKPTAPITMFPALCVCFSVSIIQLWRNPKQISTALSNAIPGVVLAALLIVPDYMRVQGVLKGRVPGVVFGLTGEWTERVFNIVVALWHHPLRTRCDFAPLEAVRIALGLPARPYAPCEGAFRLHEDMIGNPLQMAFFVSSILLGVFTWKRCPPRARWLAMLPLAGWVSMHFFMRENFFISRLQTPAFLLMPLMCGLWAPVLESTREWRRVVRALLAVPLVANLAYAYVIALRGEPRPVGQIATLLADGHDRVDDYYRQGKEWRPLHDNTVRLASRLRCRQLGMDFVLANYDYPLVWRAWQQGVRSDYFPGGSGVPCLFVSNRPVAVVDVDDEGLVPVQYQSVYVNRKDLSVVDVTHVVLEAGETEMRTTLPRTVPDPGLVEVRATRKDGTIPSQGLEFRVVDAADASQSAAPSEWMALAPSSQPWTLAASGYVSDRPLNSPILVVRRRTVPRGATLVHGDVVTFKIVFYGLKNRTGA